MRVYSLYMYSWCHCHLLSLASVKSRLVLLFWYRLTRVVPEKGPLNGCMYVCMCIVFIAYQPTCLISNYFSNFIRTPIFLFPLCSFFSLIACGRLLKHMATHTVSVSFRILHLCTVSNNHHCWWKKFVYCYNCVYFCLVFFILLLHVSFCCVQFHLCSTVLSDWLWRTFSKRFVTLLEPLITAILYIYIYVCVCLQCFVTVGWAAGRASGL